jgi:acyl-coenzyme A thioesterase PaaI-like protein
MGRNLGQGEALESARLALREAIPAAAAVLVELLNDKEEDPRLRLRAAEAILNRAGIVEAGATSTHYAETQVGGKPDPYANLGA